MKNNKGKFPRTERQFLSDAKYLSSYRRATIQFPLRYFLPNRRGAVMDTQKPLASVYRILSFADAIFIGTYYRRTYPRGSGEMPWCSGHSNSHISLRGLLLRACIRAPSFDAQVSYFFIAYLKRSASSLRAGRHKFIKVCTSSDSCERLLLPYPSSPLPTRLSAKR